MPPSSRSATSCTKPMGLFAPLVLHKRTSQTTRPSRPRAAPVGIASQRAQRGLRKNKSYITNTSGEPPGRRRGHRFLRCHRPASLRAPKGGKGPADHSNRPVRPESACNGSVSSIFPEAGPPSY